MTTETQEPQAAEKLRPAEPAPEAATTGPFLVPLAVFYAHSICDQESTRYALGGIRFESHEGRPYAIATDGRRMVVLSWNPSAGKQLEAIVSARAFASACKAIKAGPSRHLKERGEVEAGSVSVAWEGGEAITCQAPPMDGKFPPWQDVITPIGPEHRTVILNAELLRDLLDVFIAAGCKDQGVIFSLPPPEENGLIGAPVMLSLKTSDEVLVCGVLMPMTSDRVNNQPKPWIPPQASKQQPIA